MTDNASSVSKMRRLLEESELQVLTSRCLTHLSNLLIFNLKVSSINNHVVYLVKYFRKKHYTLTMCPQRSGYHVVMSQDTRNTALYINWPVLQISELNLVKVDLEARNKVSYLILKQSID